MNALLHMGERLKEIREILGYNQKEFSELLSIKQQSLSKYESGALNIPDRIKVEIIQYGVRIEWLLTGEGAMFRSIGTRLRIARNSAGLDIETMATLLSISPEDYQSYENDLSEPPDDVLKRLEGNFNASSYWIRTGHGEMSVLEPTQELTHEEGHLVSHDEIDSDSFVIPMLDQSVAAGNSSSLSEHDDIVGYIQLPNSLRSYGSELAALTVRGDSMYPTIDDSDLVVCDTGGWCGEGIYVIRLDGEALVKRLSKRPTGVSVISDNSRYPSFEIETEIPIDIVGRVRAVVKLI